MLLVGVLIVVAVVAVGVGAEVTGHSQVRLVLWRRANADRLVVWLLLLDDNLAWIRVSQ
jgi:hypothetical protein